MAKIDPKKPKFSSEDRDQVILQILKEDEVGHANSHLGGDLDVVMARPLRYWREGEHERGYTYWSDFQPGDTDTGSISMVTAPAWGVIFPPYSQARLSALLRQNGYTVHIHDVNVECYHYIKKHHDKNFWALVL